MQLTQRYLVNQQTIITANEAGHVTEYKPVYQNQLKVYKGIDNVLEFKLVNADQKALDISSYTPKFLAFDEKDALVIEHDGVSIQTSDSTTFTNKGVFKVTITENDLLNLESQYIKYTIYLVDSSSDKILTYTNSHFGAHNIIYVADDAFPGPLKTTSISTFTENNDVWYSESIDAQPGINGNEALHTAAIYTDSYSGSVDIQTTLENQVTHTTDWATVKTISFTGSETQPVYANFNGVFSHIRVSASANPASKITNILVRN